MNDGYRIRWPHVVVFDVLAIALCLIMIWQFESFSGTGIMVAIVSPVMIVISSIGIVMWCSGTGSKFTNGPRWDTMNEDQTRFAASTVGIHLAVSMALMACAMPMITYENMGIMWFILLLMAGIFVLVAGIVRVADGNHVGNKKLLPKSVTTVWGTYLMLTFAIIAVPILIIDASSGTDGITVELDDEGISVDAPMTDFSIKYADISSVTLDDDFERGTRTSGYHDLKISSGNYKNTSLGSYRLAAYDGCDSCIIVTTSGGKAYAFNASTESSTQELYTDILSRLS